MNEYLCHVAKADGTRSLLRRNTASKPALIRDLNSEGYFILKLEEASSVSERPKGHLKQKSILRFTEIMATLMANGLTLKDALALARPLGGNDLGSFLVTLDAKVQKGISLHQALVEGPRGFSVLYLGLIRIGEQTGDLSSIFLRLVEYQKSREALRDKTISALVYPLFVISVALIGIALLSVFILPVLTSAITGLNPEIAHQYQNNVNSFQLSAGILFALLVLLSFGVLIIRQISRRSSDIAIQLDRWILRLPLWRSLVWRIFGLHISFSLEILLSSGFSLESAMGECSAVITNKALRASWSRVRELVVKGTKLSEALRQEGGYPEVFIGWIEVGESAHDLKRSFKQLRSFYQNQIDIISARFAALAEPVLIVFVGGIVIVLVLTFITPIFSMLGRLF
jgi:type II secretory pathway component PulF